MRLSTVGVSALRFTLALAVALLFSSNIFAQHSGGGGSGGASSSGGGGGSHGGSSGGSVSSGGGHSSSGGSSSHSSSGHSSSAGSASHSGPSHSGTSHSGTSHPNASHSNTAQSNHVPTAGTQSKTQASQKRGFFSFLRHHVPKPEPAPVAAKPEPKEPVAELRRPICFRGPCTACPAGVHGGSGCEGTVLRDRERRVCPAGEYWAGGGCLQQTWYQDDCGGLRTMMDRQAKRMREAEQDRQISCALGPRQQCSDFTTSAESESGFYQELQNKYQACQRRSPTGPRYNGFRVPGYSAGLSFDSLGFGLGRH